MHLLWLKSELLHPVDKGGRIRTYQMLRMLRREHEITYLSLDDGNAAPDAVARAGEYAHHVESVRHRPAAPRSAGYYAGVLGNLLSPLPYAIARYRSPAFARRVVELTRNGAIDVVVCDFLVSAINCPENLACPSVLFQHNVEAEIWRRRAEVATSRVARMFFSVQRDRMVRFEAASCRRFDAVIAVSEGDAALMQAEYGIDRVQAVPTGVDTEYFRPTPASERRPASLLFLGSMDWTPNADGVRYFVEEVLPRISARVPDVHLTIVGRDPTPDVQALAAASSRVTVTGTVPDVRPYLAGAAALVVPLRVGGGTRLKIFEAMASETPVVSTTIGAEGLPVEPGRHLLIGDSPEAMADAAVRLLQDRVAAIAMARAAAALVHERFGWESVARDFAAICEAVRRPRRKPSRQELHT
jgi:glycosyltransferase involved in cell wall biosynthesis